MTGKRISDYEAWPHGGVKPTTNALAVLAKIYSTAASNLIDLDDRQELSTQELIALDTYKPAPPPVSESSQPSRPGNTTEHPTKIDDPATPPDPDTSATITAPHRTSKEKTASQRRWCVILASLLIIIVTVGGTVITWEQTTHVQSTTSAPVSPPSTTSSPPPMPSSTVPTQLPLSVQITPTPYQPPTPFFPFNRAATAPLPPSVQAAHASQQAPLTQQTPLSPTTQPSPLPSPSPPGPPTAEIASASTTATTMWKNMRTGWCLEQEENDTLRLWPCNGSADQMWAEQIIPAHPESFTRNLVNSKSGKCVTYQPEPGDHISVSLAPCGKGGQGWIRGRTGEAYEAYIFQSAEIHDHMCMSAPTDIAAEGVGVQLRKCDPPSPLTDWQPSPNN